MRVTILLLGATLGWAGQDGLSRPIAPARPNVNGEMRGDILMARKQYREAIDVYRALPESAITLNKTGIAYHQLLQIDIAKRYYERAIKADKHYPEAFNNLGTVYYARKNFGRAITQYQRALKLNPKSASVWANLGTAQFARKKYELAMESYQKAMALDSDVFEHKGPGGVLLQERPIEERAKFHFYQAKLYAKQGMSERALLYLRKAIEEGYKDRDKIKDLPEFAAMRESKEFLEVLALQPRVL